MATIWNQKSADGVRHKVPINVVTGQMVTAKCGASVTIDEIDWWSSPLCRACLYSVD
jgi:hypothetical protein